MRHRASRARSTNRIPGHHSELVGRLLGPPGPELSCDECFDRLDEYVELELGDAAADQAVPGMQAHLHGCSACNEEHDSLLALVKRDVETARR
jgi:hypothetical protein